MDIVKIGDRVWCHFVTVEGDQPRAWVYPVEVVHITESGDLVCRDERVGRTRLIDETVETIAETEADAWHACHMRLQEVASEVLRLAGECNAKSKGVARVVA